MLSWCLQRQKKKCSSGTAVSVGPSSSFEVKHILALILRLGGAESLIQLTNTQHAGGANVHNHDQQQST